MIPKIHSLGQQDYMHKSTISFLNILYIANRCGSGKAEYRIQNEYLNGSSLNIQELVDALEL